MLIRHSLGARIIHGLHLLSTMILFYTGLAVFFPGFNLLSFGFATEMILIHKIAGALFVAIPVMALVVKPRRSLRFVRAVFRRWDADDKNWAGRYLPYFIGTSVELPPQPFLTVAQRISTMLIFLFSTAIALTGAVMWLWPGIPLPIMRWMQPLHEMSMFAIAILLTGHIFMAFGLPRPAGVSLGLMFGSGKVDYDRAAANWKKWTQEKVRE